MLIAALVLSIVGVVFSTTRLVLRRVYARQDRKQETPELRTLKIALKDEADDLELQHEKLSSIVYALNKEDKTQRNIVNHEIFQLRIFIRNIRDQQKAVLDNIHDDNYDEVVKQLAYFKVMNERIAEISDPDIILTLLDKNAKRRWKNADDMYISIFKEIESYSEATDNILIQPQINKVNKQFNVTDEKNGAENIERVFDPRTLKTDDEKEAVMIQAKS